MLWYHVGCRTAPHLRLKMKRQEDQAAQTGLSSAHRAPFFFKNNGERRKYHE